MPSTATPAPLVRDSSSKDEVSLLRIYVLRAMYLLLVIGLGAMIVPDIVSHPLISRGVIASLLGAVSAAVVHWPEIPTGNASAADVRVHVESPMDGQLPIAAMVGGPASADLCRGRFQHWLRNDPDAGSVIPWGYVYRHYVKRSGARWR